MHAREGDVHVRGIPSCMERATTLLVCTNLIGLMSYSVYSRSHFRKKCHETEDDRSQEGGRERETYMLT